MDITSDKFWRGNKFQWQQPFEVGDLKLSADEIIELLSPTLSEARLKRINSVVKNRTHSVVTVMENIYDRGNISAAMRSAESFGYYHFHIIEKNEGSFKSANRVTQGADKWMYVRDYENTTECVMGLKNMGYKVYATDLKAAKPIDEVDFTQPTAIVFGNEKDGISEEMAEVCDGNIIIPMQGFTQSFNISVAASLSYQRIYLQRMQNMRKNGDLTAEDEKLLLANYLLKSSKNPDSLLKMQLVQKHR